MNSHKSKMIVPIIVTVIMVLYYIIYFGFLISLYLLDFIEVLR